MANGYIAIYRKIWDSFVWDVDNPKLLMAWIDILLLANWKPKQKVIKGKIVEIPVGSFVTSYVKLAERWGVHRDTAKRWMKLFEGEKMVKITSNNSCTLITVENYSDYQDAGRVDTTAETTTEATAEATQLNKDNKGNKYINTINSICGTDAPQPTQRQKILDKWNALPVKSVKSINPNTKRYNMLNARVKEYGLDAVLEAIDNIPKSPHLLGNNSRGWTITFDWFVKPNNFIKVLEGNYIKDTVESKQNVFSDDIYDLIDE